MKGFGTLLKSELREIVCSMMGRTKNAKKINLLAVLSPFFIMIFLSFTYSKGLEQVLGIEGLVIYMALSSAFLMVIFGAMSISGVLFEKKSINRLKVLPVSSSVILIAKLASFYVYLLLLGMCYLLPVMIMKGIFISYPFICILLILLLPMIPICIAGLFALLFQKISFGHQMPVLVKYILLMAGFFALIAGITYLQSSLFSNVTTQEMIQKRLLCVPVLGWYFGGTVKVIEAVLVQLAALVILCYIMKIFGWNKEEVLKKKEKVAIKEEQYRSKGLLKCLVQKEKAQYFGIPVYVLNTIIAPIMLVVGTIVFLVKPELLSQLQVKGLTGSFSLILIFFSFCILLGNTANSSISLEGQNLEMIKTFPIPADILFLSKIIWNMILLLPAAVICVILLSFRFSLYKELPVLLLAVITLCLFTPVFGIAVNLKFPLLNYSNPTVVVKQSAACMISVFTGLGLTALIGFMLIKIQNSILIAAVYYLVMLIITVVLLLYLKKNGNRMLAKL